MTTSLTYNFLQALCAMFVGWLVGYLFYAVRLVHFSDWHRVTDFSAIFGFTAIFAFLSAVTVVPLLFWLLRRLGLAAQAPAFVALMTGGAPLTLLLLFLAFARGQGLGLTGVFAPQAAVTGAAFALTYLALRHYQGANTSAGARGFLLALPTLLLVFLFYGLPYLSPKAAICYFGDAIAGRAARHVLARYKVGDQVADVHRALPYLVGEGGPGSAGYTGGSGYHLVYQDGVITELELTD